MSSKKRVLQDWDAYVRNLRKETPVPLETEGEKTARIKRLKKDFPAFCKYYFPNYCDSGFAPWMIRGQKKVEHNDNIYLVEAVAREHAKSVRYGLFIPLFEMANGRLDNMLLVSYSYDNACELLMPVMMNLESNQRFIADYGKQKGFRGWEMGKFVTADGKSFRAIGARQSPRGTRNEEKRPDYILFDDIDTDEESNNQDRINKKWKWVERALFPCMSITGRKRFIGVGNIISKQSCIVKASKVADYFVKIDILDKDGQPSWKERYSLRQVNYMLSKMSYASGQSEYFNNPISEGTVFKNILYGKVPKLGRFKFLVNYCDASHKSTKKNDFKAQVLVGCLNNTYYIIKAFCEQTTISQMARWFYLMDEKVNNQTSLYHYMEINGLQDTFYEDSFMPRMRTVAKGKGRLIQVSKDTRKKPDKFTRIESRLEPLNTSGRLVFNGAEQNDPHMKRLVEQFEAIEPSLPAHDDGPDATEGGVWIIDHKLAAMQPVIVGKHRRKNNKRY